MMIVIRSLHIWMLLLVNIMELVGGSGKPIKDKDGEKEKEKEKDKDRKVSSRLSKFIRKRDSRKTLDLVAVEHPPNPGARIHSTLSEPTLQSTSKEMGGVFLGWKRKSDVSPRSRSAAKEGKIGRISEEEEKPSVKFSLPVAEYHPLPPVKQQQISPQVQQTQLTQSKQPQLNDPPPIQIPTNSRPLSSPEITSSDDQPLKRRIIAFKRIYKSAMQRKGVTLRCDLDTPGRRIVGISRNLAVWFRLSDGEGKLSDNSVGYHFRPGSIQVTLRTDQSSLTIDADEILVIPALKRDQIVISQKVSSIFDDCILNWQIDFESEEEDPVNVNVIVTYNSAGPKNPDIMKNLECCNESSDTHYYRVRHIIKSSLYDKSSRHYESFRVILENSNNWRSLPSYYVQDLAEDLCDEIESLEEEPGNMLVLRWDVYRAFSKHHDCIEPRLAIKNQFDLQDIFDEVLALYSATKMEELLEDARIWSIPINLEITKRMVRQLHRCRYLKSTSILSWALDRFESSFLRPTLKADILYFMERAKPFDHETFPLVRRMMAILSKRWPDDFDHIWISNYLAEASRFPIQVAEVGDWSCSGQFTVFIAILWFNMPEYFICDNRSHLFKLSRSKTAILRQDVFLEFAPLVKCLDIQHTSGTQIGANLSWLQGAVSKFLRQLNVVNSTDGFESFCFAVEYYLYLSGFVDHVMEMEFKEKITVTEWEDSARYQSVAREVIRQLMSVYAHYAMVCKRMRDIPTLLRYLGNRQLRRCIFLICWTANPRIVHNVGGLAAVAKDDLLSFVYLVLGQGWPYSDMEMLGGMLMQSFEGLKIKGGEALLEVIASIGSPVSPFNLPKQQSKRSCYLPRKEELSLSHASSSDREEPVTYLWEAPRSIWDLEDPDQSIPVLRTFLALKFGIPFGFTKSDVCEMLQDRWAPFEFEAYLNFFIERYCGIRGKKPAFTVKIRGDQFGWLKDQQERVTDEGISGGM